MTGSFKHISSRADGTQPDSRTQKADENCGWDIGVPEEKLRNLTHQQQSGRHTARFTDAEGGWELRLGYWCAGREAAELK